MKKPTKKSKVVKKYELTRLAIAKAVDELHERLDKEPIVDLTLNEIERLHDDVKQELDSLSYDITQEKTDAWGNPIMADARTKSGAFSIKRSELVDDIDKIIEKVNDIDISRTSPNDVSDELSSIESMLQDLKDNLTEKNY